MEHEQRGVREREDHERAGDLERQSADADREAGEDRQHEVRDRSGERHEDLITGAAADSSGRSGPACVRRGDHQHLHGPEHRDQRGDETASERLEPRLRVQGQAPPETWRRVVQRRRGAARGRTRARTCRSRGTTSMNTARRDPPRAVKFPMSSSPHSSQACTSGGGVTGSSRIASASRTPPSGLARRRRRRARAPRRSAHRPRDGRRSSQRTTIPTAGSIGSPLRMRPAPEHRSRDRSPRSPCDGERARPVGARSASRPAPEAARRPDRRPRAGSPPCASTMARKRSSAEPSSSARSAAPPLGASSHAARHEPPRGRERDRQLAESTPMHAPEHIDRLDDVERVADGVAEGLRHVGDGDPGLARPHPRARPRHASASASGVLGRLHERPRPRLHVEQDQVGLDGELLRHHARRDQRDRRHRRGGIAQRVQRSVGRHEPWGLCRDRAPDLRAPGRSISAGSRSVRSPGIDSSLSSVPPV